MNVDRMQAIIQDLRDVHERDLKLDMGQWSSKQFRTETGTWKCGTAACAIGWHLASERNTGLFMGTGTRVIPTIYNPETGKRLTHYDAIAYYLDIPVSGAKYLFDIHTSVQTKNFEHCVSKQGITPLDMISAIELYMEKNPNAKYFDQ